MTKDVLDQGTRAASEMALSAAKHCDFLEHGYFRPYRPQMPEFQGYIFYDRPGVAYPLPGVAGAPGDVVEGAEIEIF